MPISRSTRATSNPFDSDDETQQKPYANPFDDDNKHIKNPHAPASKPSKPVKSNGFDSRNPFDVDDDDDFVNQVVKSSKPLRRSSDESGRHAQNATGKATTSDQKVQRSRNVFKDSAADSGAAVTKKTQKIRDAGVKNKTGYDDNHARDELFGKSDLVDSSYGVHGSRVRYDDSQFQKQDLEYKNMEDLEGYAVQKAKDTTSTAENCLRVAEEIRGEATNTLITLHQQGKQIERAHNTAVDIDQNLSRGEKLLGSLGGMFSRTWKPKKTRALAGPAMNKNDSFKRRGYHLEQRVALGINRTQSKGRNNRTSRVNNTPQTTQEIVDAEKSKQDDTLSDLSNVLVELKGMTLDMGNEISSHIEKMDGLDKDVETLHERVQGANNRARRLLRR